MGASALLVLVGAGGTSGTGQMQPGAVIYTGSSERVTQVTEEADAPATVATPYSISPDQNFVGRVAVAGDQDWIGVQLEAGTSYRLELIKTDSDSTLLPRLQLRNASGELVPVASPGGEANLLAQRVVTPATTGRYYLELDGFTGTGAYRLSVITVAQPLGDPAVNAVPESQDAPATTATPYRIQLGQSFSGNLATANDRDWVAVQLVANTAYRIDLVNPGTGTGLQDPQLRLRDASGTQLTTTDPADSHQHHQCGR